MKRVTTKHPKDPKIPSAGRALRRQQSSRMADPPRGCVALPWVGLYARQRTSNPHPLPAVAYNGTRRMESAWFRVFSGVSGAQYSRGKVLLR